MTLLDHHLRERKISGASFARMLGVSEAYLSQLRRGRRLPSLSLAMKIERATEGEVRAAAWTAEEPDLPEPAPASEQARGAA